MEENSSWTWSSKFTDDMFGLWGYHPPSDAGPEGIGQQIGFGRIGNREF